MQLVKGVGKSDQRAPQVNTMTCAAMPLMASMAQGTDHWHNSVQLIGVRFVSVAQATNALLFTRMAIAHLIERLGSEELQAFAAAPHGFMLEAANEDLVAGCTSIAVLIIYCRNRKVLHHMGKPDGQVKGVTNLANWLQVMSLYSSSLWQRSSVCSHPTSSGQCSFACNIKCVSGCPSVCSSPPRLSMKHSHNILFEPHYGSHLIGDCLWYSSATYLLQLEVCNLLLVMCSTQLFTPHTTAYPGAVRHLPDPAASPLCCWLSQYVRPNSCPQVYRAAPLMRSFC